MKTNQRNTENVIFKEVVVIGNGPSGIAVSLLLSGRLPYFVHEDHPDEMLSARLKDITSPCLIKQNLELLAQGLEGRSMNPVSLLLDALLHPYADLGLELEPLVEFRNNGIEIDHVVIGQGPPGGTWHRIDPDILTLSLGSWMALPGIPFPSCTAHEKRAFARDVATYYKEYVKQKGLTKYFKENALVTSLRIHENCVTLEKNASDEFLAKKKNLWVKKIDRDLVEKVKVYIEPVAENSERNCFITSALNCFLSRNSRRNRLCKRPRNGCEEGSSRKHSKSESAIIFKHERRRSLCCSCCCCDSETNPISKSFTPSPTYEQFTKTVPLYSRCSPFSSNSNTPRWTVRCTDLGSGNITTYHCKHVILACGAHDAPNRLDIFKDREYPDWLVHDLRSLENKLDDRLKKPEPVGPVLVVGAGLSAADAVMAVRSRNIPVVHVFRGKTAEFIRQLPENMYPEYHKVHQMMNDGGSTYPLYKAFSEHSFTDFDSKTRTIKLKSSTGEEIKLTVSFAVVLIGSKPNLSFLPEGLNLGVFKDKGIDSKTNPLEVNPYTHEVLGQEGLFAVGPLAGDNFVRYIPGGAVAVVSELYKKLALI